MTFLSEELSVFQLVIWWSMMLSKISFHVDFQLLLLLLASGLALFPPLLNLLPTAFIYFCAWRKGFLTLVIINAK